MLTFILGHHLFGAPAPMHPGLCYVLVYCVLCSFPFNFCPRFWWLCRCHSGLPPYYFLSTRLLPCLLICSGSVVFVCAPATGGCCPHARSRMSGSAGCDARSTLVGGHWLSFSWLVVAVTHVHRRIWAGSASLCWTPLCPCLLICLCAATCRRHGVIASSRLASIYLRCA